MSTSVLETPYISPERPYSQNELKFKRDKLYRKLRLSKMQASHSCCNHFYLVRKNGRKEKEMIESGCNDAGNCSVCWKVKKTPRHLQDIAYDIVEGYMKEFENPKEILTYSDIDLERVFYTWLYDEN